MMKMIPPSRRLRPWQMRAATFIAVSVGLVFLSEAQPLYAQTDPTLAAKLEAIDDAVDAKRDELHVPGAALVIVKDDRIIDVKGFGFRDVERHLPVTAETLFAIGSSTKAFTAMTVMMSADEGKLKLTDPPRTYVPYFKLQDPLADKEITISDLLCHRSGLNRTDLAWYTGRLKPDEIIRVAGMAKPTAKLGEKFQYQNVMFLTAGEVVASVQHTPWTRFVTRRILQPLGMTSTNLSVPATLAAEDHALGYTWDADLNRLVNLPMRDIPGIAPAGAINSNVHDMAQWLRLMLGGGVFEGKRFVSQESFDELWVRRIGLSPAVGYGYGWFLRDWHGHKVMEHGGNIDGFNAQVALMPDQHLGLVLLTNVSASPLGSFTMETAWSKLVGAPDLKPTAPASIATGPAVPAAQEAGKYLLAAAKLTLEVSMRDGTLYLIAPAQPAYPLSPVAGRRYKMGSPAPDGFFITFRASASNPKVSEAYLEQPQGNAVLVKQEAEKYAGPMTVEELMSKEVEALGGEASLRKHRSLEIKATLVFEDEGITALGDEWYEMPGRHAEKQTLIAVGKRIATLHDYCDGKQAGSEMSFALPEVKAGAKLSDEIVSADPWPALHWRTLFKTVTILGTQKVGGEDAYVVEMKPEKGRTVTEYVSTSTFLSLKRETPGEWITFSDYRSIGGVKVPFKRIQTGAGGNVISTVKLARLDKPAPRSVFSPTMNPTRPRTLSSDTWR